ncbi:MAG: biosynthetic arginine decarboxylase [Bdellovibrionales bacterium]|jgi:arginine decarboxylase|nr:biosynthetic arginine decarboxylase [Bdellovibrionales bacterium]
MIFREWNKEELDKTYGITRWGEGYFDVNEHGNLIVTPFAEKKHEQIELIKVVEEMIQAGIQMPTVIRFHDILRLQVEKLNQKFTQIIKEANYKGKYTGVFPIKVNQMREVVEEIVDSGAPYGYGLEAGSKSELLAVLSMNTSNDSLVILNGQKDEDCLKLALLGRQIEKKVIVVIERFSEIKKLLDLSDEIGVRPIIGIRTRMSFQSEGKWGQSSGDTSKFGLSTSEIINVINYAKSRKYEDCISLLHFHIGSQVSNIRSIKEAVTEAGRIYVELTKLGINVEYFNVGGGLGVDYDGTKSNNQSSKNYSLDEYVADIVYGLKQLCEIEKVKMPNIISESGRSITAHHSCVVTKVLGKIHPSTAPFDTRKSSEEHIIVSNMRELLEDLTSENLQESYNDASKLKDDGMQAFKLGVLGLEDKAKLETIYWQSLKQIQKQMNEKNIKLDFFQEINNKLSFKYLCNFSVFQSTPDSWAIEQLLPIMPIHRLHERPTNNVTIADITCDSDGKISSFVGPDLNTSLLPMHNLNDNEPYYIGIFLTGAYQDVMGDMHNLFGRLNEVHVFVDEEDPSDFYIEEVIKGSTSEDVLKTMQYSSDLMARTMKFQIDAQMQKGNLTPRKAVKLVDFYEDCLKGYTYLK